MATRERKAERREQWKHGRETSSLQPRTTRTRRRSEESVCMSSAPGAGDRSLDCHFAYLWTLPRYGRQSCLLWLITIGRRSFAQQTLVKSRQKQDPASSGRLHYSNGLLQAAPNSRRTQFQSSVTHHSYWLRGNQKGRIFKASSACIHASLRQRI